jgi:hypothetical protein
MAVAIIGYEYNFALPGWLGGGGRISLVPGDHINRPSDYCNSLIEVQKKQPLPPPPNATKSGWPAPQIQPPLEDVL